MALINLAAELRLIIFENLIQSWYSDYDGTTLRFKGQGDAYQLVLHGTSPFQRFEPATKTKNTPWALLRVCKLFQRELQPMLTKVEYNTVFDFRYFTPKDFEAWGIAAGSERVARMQRWEIGAVRCCAEMWPIGQPEGSGDLEDDGSDDDDDGSDDGDDGDDSDDDFGCNEQFHGFTFTADLGKWKTPEPRHDYRDDVFKWHERDEWGECYGCHDILNQFFNKEVDDFMEAWIETGKAENSVDLMVTVLEFVACGLWGGAAARRDWREFLRRLKRNGFDVQL